MLGSKKGLVRSPKVGGGAFCRNLIVGTRGDFDGSQQVSGRVQPGASCAVSEVTLTFLTQVGSKQGVGEITKIWTALFARIMSLLQGVMLMGCRQVEQGCDDGCRAVFLK